MRKAAYLHIDPNLLLVWRVIATIYLSGICLVGVAWLLSAIIL